MFKAMKRTYSEVLSPVATITAALLSYILAENLGGNGVLAVTTLGVFFGTITVKKKVHLQEFSSMFANTPPLATHRLDTLVKICNACSGFIVKLVLNCYSNKNTGDYVCYR